MNKAVILLFSLLFISMGSCVGGPPSTSDSGPFDVQSTFEPTQGDLIDQGGLSSSSIEEPTSSPEQTNITTELVSPVEEIGVEIPGTNETAPEGILQQLAWAPKGGGPPEPPPCGDCSIELKDSFLILQDFSPSQRLWLLVYRRIHTPGCGDTTAEFVTSFYLQVDENGYLESPVRGYTSDLFVMLAIDTDTNEPLWIYRRAEYANYDCPVLAGANGSCPGAPPQQLAVYGLASVCTEEDGVFLRQEPGKDKKVLEKFLPGSELKLIGGPTCADDWSWWQVETETGIQGWMSEGGDHIDPYFLCPSS